jgi:hypothetical protein
MYISSCSYLIFFGAAKLIGDEEKSLSLSVQWLMWYVYGFTIILLHVDTDNMSSYYTILACVTWLESLLY